MRSIERYLLAWIAGALSLGLLLLALVTYLFMLGEIGEVFDRDLRNVALAISADHDFVHNGAGDGDAVVRTGPDGGPDSEAVTDATIVTQTWSRTGQKVFDSNPRVMLPFTDAEGLTRVVVAGEDWAVYTVIRAEDIVQAAQRIAARHDDAQEAATTMLPYMAALFLVVNALVVFALRRGVRTLDHVARDVAQKSETSLEPIGTSAAPKEIVPLIAAVNALMSRLSDALTAQRRFLADAAHELRTPATALRLQLQLLERSGDDATRSAAMSELKSGIDRSQRLIEQLLQVARTGVDGEPARREPVDLGDLVRDVVGALSVKADAKNIDLGARSDRSLSILGDRNQLTVLLNNLVENALRHTPENGVIDVEAVALNGVPALRVVDTGPGVPAAEREHVFERFYRGEQADASGSDGSGLGLAIVQAIAEQHGAVVSLHTPEAGIGLEVRVLFAAADPR